MGLSIHYSGRIADKNKLPELIEEVQEIATVHGWKCKIYKREFPKVSIHGETPSPPVNDSSHDGKLYGIDFTPEGSESVSVCFLSNGRMSSFMQLDCWGEFREQKPLEIYNANISQQGEVEMQHEEEQLTANDYDCYLYSCFTKTQYAGPRVHEMIIGVFRYVAKTYLADFTMVDEAQFWETGDKELLWRNFERHNNLLNGIASAFSENMIQTDEDIDTYIFRVIRNFRKRNK